MTGIRSFTVGVLGIGRDCGGRKALAHYRASVAAVAALEPAMLARSDADLRGVRGALKTRLDNGANLDDVLPEAFAAVREASRRVLGLRQVDEQILGGVALHNGSLIEMKTGEGKTLTATAPAYLNALTPTAVHIMTSDDYLAARDAHWMAPVYRLLGMDCALLGGTFDGAERRAAYAAEVTYGTYTEFCYDYLRDNRMAHHAADIVQRDRGFAIVDEADLVMIDSATTTPQLTVPADDDDEPIDLAALALMVTGLRAEQDYLLDRGRQRLNLTDAGIERVESLLGVPALFPAQGGQLLRAVSNALYAKEFWQRDRDYIVEDGAISIVDHHTGRIPAGNSGGAIHAALLAKEGLPSRHGNHAIAITSVRGYLRGYRKLAAMTGVAVAESPLYQEIYRLPVVAVAPHRPVVRVDRPILVYADEVARMAALIETVAERHARGQPVLIGTGSIERSELISSALTAAGFTNLVLNAKHHADEARIIAMSGRKGAITVVTRMAGRGVDIRLGGDSAAEHEEVLGAGGLFVLGTDLYESRRQELHLRGRAGRQGDPGESVFYLAGDELIRGSTGEGLMTKMGTNAMAGLTRPLDSKLVQLNLERTLDRRTEATRARVRREVAYSAVLDEQCAEIYRRRGLVVRGADLREQIRRLIDDVLDRQLVTGRREHRDGPALLASLSAVYPVTVALPAPAEGSSDVDYRLLGRLVSVDAHRLYDRRETEIVARFGTPELRSAELVRMVERAITLRAIDRIWSQHLRAMVDLGFASAEQRLAGQDVIATYRRDAAVLFAATCAEIDERIVTDLLTLAIRD
ncbi:MAG TPA: preprotein translocase subunit SecA [Pseudonocardiaceae bacterium]|jgi:preprotein translocase subunit SecA|nr:preprotein translocase subunit SecA [Pseudonocardiaceae bacterium]